MMSCRILIVFLATADCVIAITDDVLSSTDGVLATADCVIATTDNALSNTDGVPRYC
jgi:hypothetical protein